MQGFCTARSVKCTMNRLIQVLLSFCIFFVAKVEVTLKLGKEKTRFTERLLSKQLIVLTLYPSLTYFKNITNISIVAVL